MAITYYAHRITEDGPTVSYGPQRIFDTVEQYEGSGEWRLVRVTWRGRHLTATCLICGKAESVLHPLGYAIVGFTEGWQLLDQLVPLCQDHHHEIEKRIRNCDWPRIEAHLLYRRERESRQSGTLRGLGSERD